MNNIMKSVSLIGFALLLVLALCPAKGLAQNSDDIKTQVNTLVRKHYMDGIPYERANALGPLALPFLFEILDNSADKLFWVNTIVTIGFIEDTSAVDPLIEMLEAPRGEVDSATFRALLSVPYALGCIAANGNARSLEYLAGNLDVSSNQSIRWRFRNKPTTELIAEQSVMGLAVSGRQEARKLLRELQIKTKGKMNLKGEALGTAAIDQGLIIMDRINAKGRAAVLNPHKGD